MLPSGLVLRGLTLAPFSCRSPLRSSCLCSYAVGSRQGSGGGREGQKGAGIISEKSTKFWPRGRFKAGGTVLQLGAI